MKEKIEELIGMEKQKNESWDKYFARVSSAGQFDQKVIVKVISFLVEEIENGKKEETKVEYRQPEELITKNRSVQQGTDGITEETSVETSDTESGQTVSPRPSTDKS